MDLGDDISLATYDDTTSLPDDPFPQGLPSLCLSSNEDLSTSSTLESDPKLASSRYQFSDFSKIILSRFESRTFILFFHN